MPIGILSDEDYRNELKRNGVRKISEPIPNPVPSNESNSTNESNESNSIDSVTQVMDIKRGRTPNTKEVPEVIRSLVAESAINGESHKSVANAFGVSESSVSAYKIGAHSTASYNNPNQSLLNKVTDQKQRISKRASSKLMTALGEITPDKLAGVKVRDLAAIARDMSSIVKDMQPETTTNQTNNSVQFVFMAPRVKSMDEFNVIDVQD